MSRRGGVFALSGFRRRANTLPRHFKFNAGQLDFGSSEENSGKSVGKRGEIVDQRIRRVVFDDDRLSGKPPMSLRPAPSQGATERRPLADLSKSAIGVHWPGGRWHEFKPDEPGPLSA